MRFRRLLSLAKRTFFRQSRPSKDQLDEKLQPFLDFRNGFFIEVGANDGYSQSNTWYLEKELGWTGLLVEGIPELYEKCVRARPGSTVRGVALVDDPELQSVTMHYSDLMSVVEGGMKSTDEEQEHVARGVRIQHLDDSYSVEVPATTLESLLDEMPDVESIDFFSLDVEGFELNVLKGMNPDRYRPKLILVEARYFDEVNEFLTSNDYEHVKQMSRLDHLYRDARIRAHPSA